MLMDGKVGLIMGLANKFSIAYGISESLRKAGARLVFTSQTEYFKSKISEIAADFGGHEVILCDVSQDGDIERAFDSVVSAIGKIDFIVHSIAFSDKDELTGKYYNTTRANFLNAMNISCYSFTETCRHAKNILNEGGSIVTLTYYGSEKVVPNYNVMALAKAALETSVRYLAEDLGEFGIRVNAISAGPIKTLAASGVGEFSRILSYDRQRSPLRRNVTQQDIGDACTFLASDMSAGITGEILHVDCGTNIIGVKFDDSKS
ncbi:MAG: enoyl-ACP reductase [Holosporales bacterium]|jgi:enoyl-[acyl-carrier protein] reductase I|nr:enoyl-ACP reductase [Holosporales bacterium]